MSDVLDLGLSDPPPPRTSDVPHPVTLWVHPRFVDEAGAEHEADYELEVGHPEGCTRDPRQCVVADYVDTLGIEADLYAGFPEPDRLTETELAALDGTVRYVTITCTLTAYSNPTEGHGWDPEYRLTWSD